MQSLFVGSAAIQMVLTFIGLIGLVYAVVLTRKALKASIAVREAVGLANQINEMGTRAYLLVSGYELFPQLSQAAEPVRSSVMLDWKNSGSSPAISVQAVGTYVVQSPDADDAEIGSFSDVSFLGNPAQTLLPGDKVTVAIAMDADTVAAFYDGKSVVIVFSRVRYEDIFNNIVEIDWCGILLPGREQGGSLVLRSQRYKHHNRYIDSKKTR